MKDTTPLAMQYYLGEQSNGAKKLTDDAYPRGIGRCFVTRPIKPFVDEPWFLDNGVFPAWNRPDENGDTRTTGRDFSAEYAHFDKTLESERMADLIAASRGPDFAVVPDEPADPNSLLVSLSWLYDYIENRQLDLDPTGWYYGSRAGSIPFYLAVQDGMTPEELEQERDEMLEEPMLWHIKGIFLGGTDEFKKNIDQWREFCDKHGLKLHYGRCTQSRLQEAVDAGCDSGDSSHPLRLGGTRWARFLEVFDKVVGRRVKKLAAPTFTPWPAWVTGEEQEVA